jgi:NADH-quinone oxidoreductase subunit E
MTTTEDRLDEELTRFEPERTNLLPALHAAHELLGYLPAWAMERVGRRLHIPASEVYGVASGYTEFRFEPPPADLVQVCTGLSCRLAGADRLLTEARAAWPDAAETIPCLFLCSLAPLAITAGRMVGRATVARLREVQESEPAALDGHG